MNRNIVKMKISHNTHKLSKKRKETMYLWLWVFPPYALNDQFLQMN